MLQKTHLIVTDQFDNYGVKWTRKLIELNPIMDKDGNAYFALVSNKGRMELKSRFNLNYIGKVAQNFTYPRGRQSVTVDKCRIYIKTKDEGEVLIGTATHAHIKNFAPMFDEV